MENDYRRCNEEVKRQMGWKVWSPNYDNIEAVTQSVRLWSSSSTRKPLSRSRICKNLGSLRYINVTRKKKTQKVKFYT